MILMHRIDPARNMYRYYRVGITTDLFGEYGLERSWGRIGRRGQRMCAWFKSRAEAVAAKRRLIRLKRRRGYRLVFSKGWY